MISLGCTRPLARAALTRVALMSSVPPRITRDDSRGGLITISPAEGAPSASVVGPIHGLGDSNMGWVDVAAHLHRSMPHVRFVLPNAPNSPVTLNGGMSMPSWYDITSLNERAGQPCTGIEESQAAISSLVEEELAAGIPLERIVVGGFSQGGAMALHVGLQYPGALAGVLVMSGYLAKSDSFRLAPENAATPVAHFHGLDDPTVRIEWARKSAALVRELGHTTYLLREYDGLGHSASMEEIADVLSWLEERLPPRSSD